ncbi:MAG TPA: hypothetical protein VFI55_04205 [Mycobacterium sp.]|nr:hypothetical protein [Mycobacterium sp.]
MFTKVLLSVIVGLVAGVVVAAPAGADPSVFSKLSCSCTDGSTVSNYAPATIDRINEGIQSGMSALPDVPQ